MEQSQGGSWGGGPEDQATIKSLYSERGSKDKHWEKGKNLVGTMGGISCVSSHLVATLIPQSLITEQTDAHRSLELVAGRGQAQPKIPPCSFSSTR